MNVFITVGTTQFNSLVKRVQSAEVVEKLHHYGYKRVLIQQGSSDVEILKDPYMPVLLDAYAYKPSLNADIEAADLIISHAGAGSCMEILEKRKRLIVVINEELMHNHQIELASQLESDGHLVSCYCRNLPEAVDRIHSTTLIPYTPGNPKLFSNVLEKLYGLS